MPDSPPEKEIDIYKDTPLRLLGYANEVGEALRGLIHPKIVRASYILATGYVIADTLDKAYKASKTKNAKIVIMRTTDTFVWQMLASVAIPGYLINRICAAASYLLKRNTMLIEKKINIYSTAIGLSCIPFIIEPIDHFCDRLLDETLRKFED